MLSMGDHMTRGEIIDEYRNMSSEEQAKFNRWLLANTVVGTIWVVALIAITSVFSGENSSLATAQAQKAEMIVHAEAK
jgi:hypothetical protein